MGDDKVKAYAEAEALPVLMEIPFDRRIAEAYSRGELLTETMPEWKEKFLELYERIKESVSTPTPPSPSRRLCRNWVTGVAKKVL